METIDKIRRRKLVKGKSISGIARDPKLSLNTVKKYLKAGAEPIYQRSQQPCPGLGDYQFLLGGWLEQESRQPKVPSIRASGFVSTMPSISSTAWNGKNAQGRQVRGTATDAAGCAYPR